MRPDTRSFYIQAVQQTIEALSQHLDEAPDLGTLVSRAGFSPFHFHRVFRGMVGETMLELTRRVRMERAAWRLVHTDQSVAEIAFDAGYETHEAFTRAFRALYSWSPSGFRTMKHPRIEIAATCGIHFDPRGNVPCFVPRETGGMQMEVEIKQMPELRVASVRHVGPYNQIPNAFERLGAIAYEAGFIGKPGTAMIAIYHDDPESTPPDQLRADAALVLPEDAEIPEGLAEQRLPGGSYACTLHQGSYTHLGDVWARFMGEWLPASGHRIGDGPSYEQYLNDPSTAAEEELKTELYLPIG